MILRMETYPIILLGQGMSTNSLLIMATFAFKMDLDLELPTYLLEVKLLKMPNGHFG